MSTIKAAFGRGIPLVNLDKVPTIPHCLIFQLGYKLTPPHVTDSFCKAMVFDHVLNCQRLNTDRLVFTDQACRELMQEVTASISNTCMYSGYLCTGFGSILAALLFAGVSPLCFCQFLLILMEEFGIAYDLTIRKSHKVFQAQISTYRLLN